MVKITPITFKNQSALLYSAYGYLYSTIPNLISKDYHNESDGSLRQSDDDLVEMRRRSNSKDSDDDSKQNDKRDNDKSNNFEKLNHSKFENSEPNGVKESTNNEDIDSKVDKNDKSDKNDKLSSSQKKSDTDISNQISTLCSYTNGQKKNKSIEWPHIYLFGSLSLNEDNQLCVPSSNCFKFDWSKGDWEKQNIKLETRYQYASCQFGNKVILHGGFSNYTKDQILSTVQIFDMETLQLENFETDLALACHAGAYHKLTNSFIVFGGISIPCGKCTSSTLSKFNLQTNQWEIIEINKEQKVPMPRYGHSMVSYGDNFLVLFGGKDMNDDLLNDLWLFNLETKEWEEIVDTMGDIPPGRVFHYAIRHHHTMYILGGDEPQDADENNHPLFAFDLKTRHWDAHRVAGSLNTRKIGVSMTLFSNELIGETLIAYGGVGKSKRTVNISENKKSEVTVPLSNKMFHITGIPQYKLKRKLEAMGSHIIDKPKKRQKITPRKLVAAFVDSEWILARIVRTLENNYFELEDAQAVTEDNEEDKTSDEPPKTYIVSSVNIARLSTSMKDHIPLPRETRVLALYPGTSCLYPGVIEDHGDESYYVLFEDDEEDGETPLREIGYKLICLYQEGVPDD